MKKTLYSILLVIGSLLHLVPVSLHASYGDSWYDTIAGGSLYDSAADNFEHFSLILFELDRNKVRIERYVLDELGQDVNRFTRASSNDRCLYCLPLAEQGQKVVNIGFNMDSVHNVIVETQRGGHKTYYALNWGLLIGRQGFQAQGYMRVQASIEEVFNVVDENAHISWFTSLRIKWGAPGADLTIKLLLEQRLNAVAAVVVPNCLLEERLGICHELKKADLLQLGILKKQ